MIRRAPRAKSFAVFNTTTVDMQIPPDELGVYLHLLAKPDDWEVNGVYLRNHFSMSKNKTYRILDALAKKNLINKTTRRGSSGRYDTQYEVVEPVDQSSKEGLDQSSKTGPVNEDVPSIDIPKKKPSLSVEPIIKPEYLHFHLFMIDKILQVHSGFKQPNANTWCKDIRLMVERDNRQLQDMGRVFTWANNDEFWCGNILSPAKLRKQFDKLVIQMKDSPRPKKKNYWDMDDSELVRLCLNAGFRTQGKSKKELVSKLESAA